MELEVEISRFSRLVLGGYILGRWKRPGTGHWANCGMESMKRKWLLLGVLVASALAVGIFLYHRSHSGSPPGNRAEILAILPDNPTAVVFLDLRQFRSSAFLPQLMNWAPAFPADEDYVKFVEATGFRYETDLDQVALAFTHEGNVSTVFAVAAGRFNRKKIEAYAAQSGERKNQNGRTVFQMTLKNSTRKSFFTFLRDDRIAWTNDPTYKELFEHSRSSADKVIWDEQFARLGGTGVFAVIRQDPTTAQALEQQTPSGFRSPQLAALLGQLQWITIGGKPEGQDLRIVLEGQSSTESTIRQLKDFLSGILILAQAGLSGPVNKKQMQPQLRETYLDLLKSTQVDDIDRGGNKSVRVIFTITPGFLEAVNKTKTAGTTSGQ